MELSYTEKKRPRANFGKQLDTLEVPPLLDIQLKSYQSKFLQAECDEDRRDNIGLQSAFQSVFPIVSFSGFAQLEFVKYTLGTPAFNVKECQLRGLTYAVPLRVLVP